MVQFEEPVGVPKPVIRKKIRQRARPRKTLKAKAAEHLRKKLRQWWQKESIQYAFNIPQVRSRLEKLMGTNYVNLTDREYMQKLQQRILEDYEDSMHKRIKAREEEEIERVKNLVLIGKIPLDQAPPEMARHPIMLIENYCNKLIAERRAKIKMYKIKIPTYLYWDDTPDPPTGLSIEMGHVFDQESVKLCQPVEKHLESSEEEDLQLGYMMAMEDFDKAKYENDLVKKLLSCEMRSYRTRMLGYTSALIVFLTLRNLPGVNGEKNLLLPDSQEIIEQSLDNVDDLSDGALDEEQLDRVGMFLTKLLLVPWPEGSSPLLYIEKDGDPVVSPDLDGIDDRETTQLEDQGLKSKRTRYYRKYPWKRQNNRYEPSYVCTPKKDDVFRLLMALHGERNGHRGQFVDFCNRKRPATFVFTNIRFLG